MKRYGLIFAMFSLLVIGCDDRFHMIAPDYTPPAIPSGVEAYNGNNFADISWRPNREADLAGYNVYYSYSYNGKYMLIGSTQNTYFTHYAARNGVIYYYAVTAYDVNGNESDLSYESAYAAPRPDGFNQAIYDFRRFPDHSGYDFGSRAQVAYDDLDCDFFFDNDNGHYYLDVYDDTDIKDMGLTIDITDITYAPNGGWSTTKDARVYVGHTYIIWTWDNHFAKVRVRSVTPDRVVFDWAYQLIEGEPSLRPVKKGGTSGDRILSQPGRNRNSN